MSTYKTIAETQNFIVLEHYTKHCEANESPASYQTEADLEQELIADLVQQGYQHAPHINSQESLLANIKCQIESLNQVCFSLTEWKRFVNEYLDAPNDSLVDKANKVHNNYVCDFKFDNGSLKNIYIINKENLTRNTLQVISQFAQSGSHANRYDVTLLVNGIPMVQIELKKRGVAIKEAFNQVHRYSKESLNNEHSLFKYIQTFVISNGTDTRYFANTIERNKNSFDFTMNWAKADNKVIKDLKDFTSTFLQKTPCYKCFLPMLF